MPRVHFTQDFDWSPKSGVTIAYKAGYAGLVTTRCANAAIEAKKAKRTTKKAAPDERG